MGSPNALTALPQQLFDRAQPLAAEETVPSWFNSVRDRATNVLSQDDKTMLAELEGRVEASAGLVIAALADLLHQGIKTVITCGLSIAATPLRATGGWEWTKSENCNFEAMSQNFAALKQSALRVCLAVSGILTAAFINPEKVLAYYQPKAPADDTQDGQEPALPTAEAPEVPATTTTTTTPPATTTTEPSTPVASGSTDTHADLLPPTELEGLFSDDTITQARASDFPGGDLNALLDDLMDGRQVFVPAGPPATQPVDDGSGVGLADMDWGDNDEMDVTAGVPELLGTTDDAAKAQQPKLFSVIELDDEDTIDDDTAAAVAAVSKEVKFDDEKKQDDTAAVAAVKKKRRKKRRKQHPADTAQVVATPTAADVKAEKKEAAVPSKADLKFDDETAVATTAASSTAVAQASEKTEAHPHALSRESSRSSSRSLFMRMASRKKIERRKEDWASKLAAELAKDVSTQDPEKVSKYQGKVAKYNDELALRSSKDERHEVHASSSADQARSDFAAAVAEHADLTRQAPVDLRFSSEVPK